MAYVKTVWKTGDVITAEKLNNIEDGVEANSEAIADAFVAPEVSEADQGKVMTVDSSGEWAAENLPADTHAKDVFVFTGTIEIPLTLDSGTVTITENAPDDLIAFKYIALALDVPSLQTPGTFMARLILPLYLVNYAGTAVSSYQFKCSFGVLGKVVHVDIEYQVGNDAWAATVTNESA